MSESNINIDIICRQTTYTREEAESKLEAHSNNVSSVLKEYLGVTPKPEKKNTINQQIYGELRTFMDNINEQCKRKSTQKIETILYSIIMIKYKIRYLRIHDCSSNS